MSHPRNRSLARGIYKRGNSYYLDYKDETGRRIRRSAGPDLHHALDLLYKLRGPQQNRTEASLRILFDSYLARQRVYSKPKSVRNAASSIRRLIRHFGDPMLSELSSPMLDAFIEKRRWGGAAAKTINGDLIILRAALNHGVSVGLASGHPLKIKFLIIRHPSAG